MTTTTATSAPAATVTTAAPASRPTTLDALAALDIAALTAVYRGGSVPDSLAALDGNPTCRMLAIRGLDHGLRGRAVRALAAARFFPWAGKSFAAEDAAHGRGVNRVRLGDGKRWFPFATKVEPSAIDGRPCIFLDYDQAPNPRPIRMIRDELREVAPGLFLGPAMLDDGRRPPRLALWFACDARGARA